MSRCDSKGQLDGPTACVAEFRAASRSASLVVGAGDSRSAGVLGEAVVLKEPNEYEGGTCPPAGTGAGQ